MTTHLTVVRRIEWDVVAYCPEHHQVGLFRRDSTRAWNAAITEARAHDDTAHSVYRTDAAYRRLTGM